MSKFDDLDNLLLKISGKYENVSLNIDDMEDKPRLLYKLQNINNNLYEKYGLVDEVLDLQLWINGKRYEWDIVDDGEIIHHFDDGEFVQ